MKIHQKLLVRFKEKAKTFVQLVDDNSSEALDVASLYDDINASNTFEVVADTLYLGLGWHQSKMELHEWTQGTCVELLDSLKDEVDPEQDVHCPACWDISDLLIVAEKIREGRYVCDSCETIFDYDLKTGKWQLDKTADINNETFEIDEEQ